MVPSELLAKRRYCIMGNHAIHNNQQIYDVFREFQEAHIDHEHRISTLELNQTPKQIKNPANITINKNGQITAIEEAAPQGPFTILPVTTNTDFTVINPYTLVSTPPTPITTMSINTRALSQPATKSTSIKAQPAINSWTGRWITKEVFNGSVKLSFHIDNPKAFIGLVSSGKKIESDKFKTNFKAGFFFKSASVFGVIDTAMTHDDAKSNIFRVERTWSNSDTFNIVYSPKLIQYYHNDENIYTVTVPKSKKGSHKEDKSHTPQGVYVAGAFYTTQTTPITVSQIAIQELLPSTQPIMEYTENNIPQVLTLESSIIASVLIQTDVGGKLAASANIVSTDVTFLTLRIKGEYIYGDESTSITIDKYGNIMFGTTGLYPAGKYIVELSASGNATVKYAHLQAMAQLL